MVEENGEPRSSVKKAWTVKVWLAGALSVLVFILIIQNTQAVTVSILFWNLQVSLIILIPFIFLIGMVVGYVLRRKR
jgi:uncharacterized integral membrane protein